MKAGADEIDMVIDRGAFLAGDYLTVFNQIAEVKAVCGDARLKVIMETGELVTYDNVRRASWLSMLGRRRLHQDLDRQGLARRDPARHPRHARGRARLARPHRCAGRRQARRRHPHHQGRDQVPRQVSEIAGEDWLTPDWFRFGASGLLNDLLLQRQRIATGAYSGADYVTTPD